MSAEPYRKRKSTSTSGKKQKKVKPDDGLKRLVETSNIFQTPAFQNPDEKWSKQEFIEIDPPIPLNPKVSTLVEETRAVVDCRKKTEDVEETEKAIPHMVPLEEGELSCNHYPSDEEIQLEEFLGKPANLRTCPFHDQPLENCHSRNGWNYVKCLTQPCLIFCGQDQVEPYMREIYKNVHIDIFGRWGELLCFCRYLPALRQSQSTANPGRMYLNCRGKPNNRCKFFRWADLPVKREDMKDPISVREWLTDTPPAAPPSKYSESLQDFLKRC